MLRKYFLLNLIDCKCEENKKIIVCFYLLNAEKTAKFKNLNIFYTE